MFDAIYVISKTGLPIYCKQLVKNDKASGRATLLSGVISAIQSFLVEIDAGEANYFVTESNEIYIEMSDKFGVVLTKDRQVSYKKEIIDGILTEIVKKIIFENIIIQEHISISKELERKLEIIILNAIGRIDKNLNLETRFSDKNLADFHRRLNEEQNITITPLLESVKTGLDSVFISLFACDPIIVFGDRTPVEEIVNILNLISPFPLQNVINYTTGFLEPIKLNILGAALNLAKYYKSSNVVKITLSKNIVQGLSSNKYLRNLADRLKEIQDETEIKRLIEKEFSLIFSKCSELLQLSSVETSNSNHYQKLKKETSDDLWNLIVEICIKTKPSLKAFFDKQSFFGFNF